MYPEQFYLLEKGDIIRQVRSKSIRKVLAVSKRHGETYFIELEKLKPSWTRSYTTTYSANEADNFVPIKVKNKKIWGLTYEAVLAQRIRTFEHYKNVQIKFLKKRLAKLKAK